MAKQRRLLNYNNIHLVRIDILKEEILNDSKSPLLSEDVETFKFNTTIDKNLNPLQGWASIKFTVNIFPQLSSKKKTKAKSNFIFEFVFFIDDIKKYIKNNTQEGIEIDTELDEWITLLSFDTMRGILFEKLKNSFLDKCILPLSTPEMLNQD